MQPKPPSAPFRRPAKRYAQAHRLVDLYRVLLLRGRLRLDEVAARFGVSLRTVQRDAQILTEVLPGLIRSDSSKTDGGAEIRLPFDANRWKVQRQQLFALAVGASMTSFLSGPEFVTDVRPLLDQLAEGLSPAEQQRLTRLERKVIVLEPGRKRYAGRAEVQERLSTLVDALLREAAVDVDYWSHQRRRSGESPRRMTVLPLCVALHRGGVYFVVDVLAGDWTSADRRILLALDRLTEVTASRQPVARAPDFDPATWFAPAFGKVRDRAPAKVVLLIDPILAPYVAERTWHASERLEPQPGGGLVVRLDVGDWNEVLDVVLGMGERAEVLSPPEMRREMARRLEAASARYR